MLTSRDRRSLGQGVSRPLTRREIATLRAALRLWIDTTWMPDAVFVELDGVVPIDDAAIEQLLDTLTDGAVWIRRPAARDEAVAVAPGEHPPDPIDPRD